MISLSPCGGRAGRSESLLPHRKEEGQSAPPKSRAISLGHEASGTLFFDAILSKVAS